MEYEDGPQLTFQSLRLALEASLLSESLAEFVKAAWHVLEPTAELKWGWAMDAICQHLEAVTDGRIKRLLINVSPGSSKSLLTSVFWPAWEWTRPELRSMRFLSTSHKLDLAVRDNIKCRRLIQSEWYQSRWPIEIVGDQNAKTKFENVYTGFREAMAFTSMTGSRGDRVCCLPYNQTILTNQGDLRIGDIVENRLPVKVLGLHDYRLVWQDIELHERNPAKEAVRINAGGRQIECTVDHPVYVQGRGYVEAGTVRPGEWAWQLDSKAMLQLRDGISRAQDTGKQSSLQHGMQVGIQEEPGAFPEFEALRNMRSPLLQDPKSCEESEQALLRECLRCACNEGKWESAVSRGQAGIEVPKMREAFSSGPQRGAKAQSLLTKVRGSTDVGQRNPRRKIEAARLRTLREGIQADQQQEQVLLDGMQGQGSRSEDVWCGKCSLCAWGIRASVSNGVVCDQESDPGSGRLCLQGMPTTSGRSCENVACTPHRLQQEKQRPAEPGFAVRELSWESTPQKEGIPRVVAPVLVESVERIPRIEVSYNVRVSPAHNYFADGILVHNCDDPHSVDDANSEAAMLAAERTFLEALPTRVNNERSAIIVIMQRLAERDVSGLILSRDLGYEHLMIPMEFERSRRCRTSIGFVDPRKTEGELFFPERFSIDEVTALKKSLGTFGASGQLQQNPAPRGGGMFKEDHIRLWPHERELPRFRYVIKSYDTAFTEKTANDPTAYTAWGVFDYDERVCVMLLDAWDEHLEYSDLRTRVISEWKDTFGGVPGDIRQPGRRADLCLVENKGSGISLLQDLRKARVPAHSYNPGKADKYARASLALPAYELGIFYVPESRVEHGKPASWARAFLHQLHRFGPQVADHDDYVDTFTQAVIYLRDAGLLTLDAVDPDDPPERTSKGAKRSVYG